MIRKDGLIKLMDFGIAQILDLQRLTVTGQLLGSPAYMAPEIIEGKPIDFRTDVFSVGVLLYLLATGTLPFWGKNPHEVLRRITDGRYPDPRSVGRGVDESLARIITRAIARDPAGRYPGVAPMTEDLRAYLADAGLTDVRAELRALFLDPDAYEASLPPRLAAALAAAAQDHLAANRRAKALELWNRVLAFDPQNAAVAAALRRMERRRRLRTTAAGVAAATAMAAISWGAIEHGWSHRPPRTEATIKATPAVAPPAAHDVPSSGAPVPAPASARRVAPNHLARLHGAPRADAPDDAAETRTFRLGPTPQNVDVFLDDKRQFAYDVDHTTIDVPWTGTHVIELKSPSGCCFVERVEVGPDRPLPADEIIARRLKWRPARVVVSTEPPVANARVLVRDPNREVGASAGRPGEEIDVPFFPDDESSKLVEISVDAGDAFATETVHVRAGQRLRQVVKLKPGAN
jgi:protein kinase-like protein